MSQAAHADVGPQHHDTHTLGRDALAGALAGQIAGLVMAVVLMAVFTLFLGKGPLFPVQVIGSVVVGDSALDGFHAGAFLAGLIVHQAGPALIWGLAFGLLVHQFQIRSGPWFVLLALVVGLSSQVVDVELLMGPVMTTLHGHNIWAEQVPSFWSWAAHVVFGLGLVSHSFVSRKLSEVQS